MQENTVYGKKGETPVTRKSVAAFLDVLGFRRDMTTAYREGSAANLLVRLRKALDRSYQEIEETSSEGRSPVWRVKAFTDNIVIGAPIHFSDAEGELGSVLLALRYYQMQMVNAGFFVRGAVSIGNLYMDDEIVFGDALIEAHEAEGSLARDPRIVLSRSLTPYVERHLKYYGKPAESPHNAVLLRDSDEQLFVNYLGVLFDEGPESLSLGPLQVHKQVVEQRLVAYRSEPPIWSKYAWVGQYHNFICSEQGFSQYKIDQGLLRLHPRRMIES